MNIIDFICENKEFKKRKKKLRKGEKRFIPLVEAYKGFNTHIDLCVSGIF